MRGHGACASALTALLIASAAGAQTARPGATETPVTETPVAETPEAETPEAETPEAETPEAETPEAAPPLVPPRLLGEARPNYPAAAQAAGVAASVTLEIDIDTEGAVTHARVVQTAEAAGMGFDEAALEAARSLRFEPATEGGTPIAVRIHYRFAFVPDTTPGANAPAAPSAPPGPTPTGPSAQAAAKPVVPSGELWGALRERGTRTPLPGVKVTVFRGEGDQAVGFETETDNEGHFLFRGLGPGEWRLLGDPEGYFPLRTHENVVVGQRTEVQYLIEKSAYNPYDVMVDAKRIRREVTQRTIDTKRADRVPGTFGDVLAVVQNFPGVARVPFGDGQLVIRGSAPEDSKQFIGGMHIPQVYHFGGLRSVLTVGMTDHIDFYPGNFSAKYGRASGGITDVGLKALAPDKVGGYADIGLFDTSLYLEAPITDNLAIAVGGRRSYIDVVLGAALPNNGNGTVAPRYYDVQALATYRPSATHQLSTFFLLSDDEFRLLLDEPVGDDAETLISNVGFFVNFYRGMAEYRYVPSPRFENHLQLSFGKDHFNINIGEDLAVDTSIETGQVRDTARYAWSDALALKAGVDYLYERVTGGGTLPGLPREGDADDDPDLSEGFTIDLSGRYHSTAAFAELEVRPFADTLILPGVRVEHFSRTGKNAVSPRLTVRHSLSEQWALKAGVGHFAQEPEFEETERNIGNPKLGLKQAIHYSAGFEYKPLPNIELDVTGFYKTLFDQVSRSDQVGERNGLPVALNLDNSGKGRVMGLEVSARHELAHGLFGFLAYTLSRAERRDSGSSNYRLFDFDQTHILTAVGSYQLPRNWEISSRFRYVTGNVYTPIIGAVYNSDSDAFDGIPGPTNSARVAPFHQLDVRIDKRWVYDGWMLNAYLDIQNIYDRVNEDDVQYNYDYTETSGSPGLPLLPVIGLRGEF